jgi:hypothetical protein
MFQGFCRNLSVAGSFAAFHRKYLTWQEAIQFEASKAGATLTHLLFMDL